MTDEVNDGNVDMELDEFSNIFFNREAEKAEPEAEEKEAEVPENEDDPLATEEDEPEAEAEAEAEEESEDEPEAKEEPKPKKKSSLQTRIDELVAKAREAERENELLKLRLEAVEKAREEKPETKAEVPLRDQLPPEAPNPDALNENGEPIYELGEFDPKYIRDLTRFTIEQETKKANEKAAEEAKARAIAEEQAKLQQTWADKVKAKVEEVPDFQEKAVQLTQAFSNLDPQYGDYLANTIMQLDNGPDVLYYLSQNIGEARDIVASGPFAATLAIGRLQAKLEAKAEKPEREEPSNTKKVSEAPEPPSTRVRGAGGKFTVSPDTDDLDAFEREFFGKRR